MVIFTCHKDLSNLFMKIACIFLPLSNDDFEPGLRKKSEDLSESTQLAL
jgi:hypothetical protein